MDLPSRYAENASEAQSGMKRVTISNETVRSSELLEIPESYDDTTSKPSSGMTKTISSDHGINLLHHFVHTRPDAH